MMKKQSENFLSSFKVISINYKSSDVKLRGRYAIFSDVVPEMAALMVEKGIMGFCISTCNRSEFYASAISVEEMAGFYCRFCDGDKEEMLANIVVLKGEKAVNHLFRLSAGLESQIIGDFEVIGQIRKWYGQFKKHGIRDSGLDRLVQTAQKISKKIKTETSLSSGATSVSFAAANYLLTNVEDLANKDILLFGIGKIGQNTCENLIKHIEPEHIYLVNRTEEKALKLAKKFSLKTRPIEDLVELLNKVDVVIVATGAGKFLITPDLVKEGKKLTILDLSIPENVDPELAKREQIDYQNIDEISKLIHLAVEKRKAEVPKAETIVRLNLWEYLDWIKARQYIPKILDFKAKLESIRDLEIKEISKKNVVLDENDVLLANKIIDKMSNYLAFFLKENENKAEKAYDLMDEIFMISKK